MKGYRLIPALAFFLAACGGGDAPDAGAAASQPGAAAPAAAAPAAQPLTALGTGPPPEGACINLGGSCFRSDLYRATVSALGPASGAAELEGQYSVVQAGTGGYR